MRADAPCAEVRSGACRPLRNWRMHWRTSFSGTNSGRRCWRFGNDARRRRGQRLQRRSILDEEAEHEPFRTSGAWGKQPRPPLPPERLAHLLIRRPRLPPRRWRVKPDASESIGHRQVGDIDTAHAVAPYVARKVAHWWNPSLSKMPIPLGPERVRLIGEIQRVDDRAALPAVIARGLRSRTRICIVRHVAQPCAGGVDWIDVERQMSDLRRRPATRAPRQPARLCGLCLARSARSASDRPVPRSASRARPGCTRAQ